MREIIDVAGNSVSNNVSYENSNCNTIPDEL